VPPERGASWGCMMAGSPPSPAREPTCDRTPEARATGAGWPASSPPYSGIVNGVFLGVPDSRRIWRLRAASIGAAWLLACLPVWLGRGGCPFAEILGIPCPGCGMTRAFLLLANGELGASLRMHPLLVPNVLAAAFFMGGTVWTTARVGSPAAMWSLRVGRAAIVAFGAVQMAMLGLWAARMLGFFGGPVPV
jgi:hypothetical protein